MKKRIRGILCATLSLTLLLAGCGAKQEEPQEEPITQQETDREPQIEASAPEAEETETQQELTGEEESNTDSSPIFTMDNPVIYDAEGVTVTMDEITLLEDDRGRDIELTVSVTNNNPDNKKVSFLMNCIANGCVVNDRSLSSENITDGITVGDSLSLTGTISLHSYDELFKEFGGTVNEELPPIAHIDCSYFVQIGSDAVWTDGITTIRNTQYSTDDVIRMYGDKVNEIDAEGFSFEIYLKHNEIGESLITVVNRTKTPPLAVDFNGNTGVDYHGNDVIMKLFPGNLLINDDYPRDGIVRSSYDAFLDSGYENGTFVSYLLAAPEEIRRQLEISNDTPLNVVLDMILIDSMQGGFTGRGNYKMTIPLTTIE